MFFFQLLVFDFDFAILKTKYIISNLLEYSQVMQVMVFLNLQVLRRFGMRCLGTENNGYALYK